MVDEERISSVGDFSSGISAVNFFQCLYIVAWMDDKKDMRSVQTHVT